MVVSSCTLCQPAASDPPWGLGPSPLFAQGTAACSATGIFHCHTIQTNMSSSHWVAKLYWKEISERSVWSPSQPSSLLLIITLSSPYSSPCLQGNWFGTRTTFVESLMHCQHFYDVQLLLIWFLPPTKYLFRWTGYIWRSEVTSD